MEGPYILYDRGAEVSQERVPGTQGKQQC
ncbi:hypothetical protein RSOL_437080 [Rhizoctonia solani AG-3 Rhs1AP]|uniref:Uncharacterized protein n=1 Tax=Rhizoctonia solani AG-3 Rhs1AP TaxID=1086054 RepID=X8JMI7_9AGAM|nr:hypothetical protein RSOL_437080 [Rhizoctonia solani AG-3 Rhs1AP]